MNTYRTLFQMQSHVNKLFRLGELNGPTCQMDIAIASDFYVPGES